jgi:hypothetical protein
VEPDFDVIVPIVLIVGSILVVVVFAVVLTKIIRAISAGASGNPFGGTSATGPYTAQGLRARGLVLTSNRVSSGVTVNGRRFEQRSMTLDVEIPGRPPFVASGTFLVPRGIVEALPGSSLDLDVHPTNMSQITVLGPGGFTGPWLNFGPPNSY